MVTDLPIFQEIIQQNKMISNQLMQYKQSVLQTQSQYQDNMKHAQENISMLKIGSFGIPLRSGQALIRVKINRS